MQVTETLSEGLKRAYSVVIPASDLAAKLDSQLADMKNKVRINGFRDGLQKLMLDFEDATNRGAAQVSVAGEKMRQSLGEFSETSEKIAGGTRATVTAPHA